jgi:hypothetical protein
MYKVVEITSGIITSFDVYGEALNFVSNNVGYIMYW